MRQTRLAVLLISILAASISSAMAQDASPIDVTTRFILDTGLSLAAGLAGILVLAGFCLRDVGLARLQNAPAVCLRAMSGLGVCILAFWLCGYNLIHSVEKSGLLGEFSVWVMSDEDPITAGRAAGAQWFFEMTLAAIGVAIISGAISERVKLWPFVFFAAAYSALVYPIIASWIWGGGYLASDWRFYDFGGGAVVHVAAGAAGFAAAFIIGPRPGKYSANGVRVPPSTALPLSVIGAVLMLVGFLIVLAGMRGSFSSIEDGIVVSAIIVNALTAAGAGLVTALFITKAVYRRAGIVSGLSAILGALVAISADPVHPSLWEAAMIGATAGVIVAVAPPFLDRLRIDDATLAVPSHLLCGMWGVLIVPWTNSDVHIVGQIIGVAGIAGFSFFMTMLFWVALKYTVGVRSVPLDHVYADDD